MYAASRAELVAEVIAPAIERGAWVIADRFLGSSLVYQGVARGLGVEQVRSANLLATGAVLPDVTLLLDLPADVAAARRAATGTAPDRIEQAGDAFMSRVADAYRELASLEPGWVCVSAAATPEVVFQDVLAAVAEAAGTDLNVEVASS